MIGLGIGNALVRGGGILDAGPAPFGASTISGMKVWLKPEALSALSDGDSIGNWPDSSGNGNDFTMSAGSLQPIYKTNIVNGKSVARFDATDDVLIGVVPGSVGVTQTILAVIRCATATWPNYSSWYEHDVYDGSSRLNTYLLYGGKNFAIPQSALRKNGANVADGTTIEPIDSWMLIANQPPNAPTSNQFWIGWWEVAYSLGADLAELIVYHGRTPSQCAAAESYLMSKYGIV